MTDESLHLAILGGNIQRLLDHRDVPMKPGFLISSRQRN
jgi:hypothetical protein